MIVSILTVIEYSYRHTWRRNLCKLRVAVEAVVTPRIRSRELNIALGPGEDRLSTLLHVLSEQVPNPVILFYKHM